MGRQPRIIIPGIPHHIVHKGNNSKRLFHQVHDYYMYLSLLKHYSQKHNFRTLSYCLMPNHVHIVGIPGSIGSTSLMIRDTHQKYSSYLNMKMNATGHNWQNRHYLCPCDEAHGIASMRYVELNPVRAGIVNHAWNYEWSSAMAHVGLLNRSDLLDLNWWRIRFTTLDWKEMLCTHDADMDQRIEENTKTGLPLGTLEFVQSIDQLRGSENSNVMACVV